MEHAMLERMLALIELNLHVTVLVSVVYGVLLAWIIRETRLSHQALRDIATMVRDPVSRYGAGPWSEPGPALDHDPVAGLHTR